MAGDTPQENPPSATDVQQASTVTETPPISDGKAAGPTEVIDLTSDDVPVVNAHSGVDKKTAATIGKVTKKTRVGGKEVQKAPPRFGQKGKPKQAVDEEELAAAKQKIYDLESTIVQLSTQEMQDIEEDEPEISPEGHVYIDNESDDENNYHSTGSRFRGTTGFSIAVRRYRLKNGALSTRDYINQYGPDTAPIHGFGEYMSGYRVNGREILESELTNISNQQNRLLDRPLGDHEGPDSVIKENDLGKIFCVVWTHDPGMDSAEALELINPAVVKDTNKLKTISDRKKALKSGQKLGRYATGFVGLTVKGKDTFAPFSTYIGRCKDRISAENKLYSKALAAENRFRDAIAEPRVGDEFSSVEEDMEGGETYDSGTDVLMEDNPVSSRKPGPARATNAPSRESTPRRTPRRTPQASTLKASPNKPSKLRDANPLTPPSSQSPEPFDANGFRQWKEIYCKAMNWDPKQVRENDSMKNELLARYQAAEALKNSASDIW